MFELDCACCFVLWKRSSQLIVEPGIDGKDREGGSGWRSEEAGSKDRRTIFWPPGPLPHRNDSRMSDSGIWRRGGSCFTVRMEDMVNVREGKKSGCFIWQRRHIEALGRKGNAII